MPQNNESIFKDLNKELKPKLPLSQIINMCVGFFGIQFGWDLQRANMGRIYEGLGANPDDVPLLFLAAPLTGLLVQPIIGYLSDRTWHPKFGRRRPYFFIGALFSSIALIFMPHSSALWMAAGLLWVLDVFGNVSMEPFRAFVTDKLPDSQINRGFTMQSLMIGLGGSIASALPWIFSKIFNKSNITIQGGIAENVKWSFYTGAFFFFAAVLYTVLTTKEYPPLEDHKETETKKDFFTELFEALKNMHKKMKIVSLVQFFTWPGLFFMWFYYTQAVAIDVFGGKDSSDLVYGKGADFASLTYSFFSVVTFMFAFALPHIANKLGRKTTHSICLLIGAIGLISIGWVKSPYMLYASMGCVGIAWTSILSMPYDLISKSLPANRVGIYMGIFNFFIVLPEIIAALGFGSIMQNVLHNNRVLAVQLGGGLFIIAAVLCYSLIKDEK